MPPLSRQMKPKNTNNKKTLTHSKQQSRWGSRKQHRKFSWQPAIPLHRLAALFRRSGTLSLHTVMAVVPFLCSGSSSIGSGTFQQRQRHPSGHSTLKHRWQHPLHTQQQQEVRGKGPQQENPQEHDCNKKAPSKQDYNKSWTEAAGLKSLHA